MQSCPDVSGIDKVCTKLFMLFYAIKIKMLFCSIIDYFSESAYTTATLHTGSQSVRVT